MRNIFTKKIKGTMKDQCFEEKNVLTQEVEEVSSDQKFCAENFISAKDALEKTYSQWTTVPIEKIFEEINKNVKWGERIVYFREKVITDEQKKFLEELGYEVKIVEAEKSIYKTPYFSVSW